MEKKEKEKLLEAYKVFERSNWKQLLTLVWWEFFNKKKLEKFYLCMKHGNALRLCYEIANQTEK